MRVLKMKRNIFLTSIIFILLIVVFSCGLEPMEAGRSVNEYIFPYIFFELSEDENYYTASILSGAAVGKVYIPGYVDYFDNDVPVKEFTGFENPEDSVNLVEIRIDATVERIAEGAFEKAVNLKKIIIVGNEAEDGWSNLPILTVAGSHFHGWKITSDGAEAVMYELIHHEAKDSTCTENGNVEYWECPECGKLFGDLTAEDETTKDKVVVEALGHKPEFHERKEANCGYDGNIAYWGCTVCGNKFYDIDCTKEIENGREVIKATGKHTFGSYESMGESGHMTQCSVCYKTYGEMKKHRIDEINWASNSKGHWHACADCDYQYQYDSHTYRSYGDEKVCEICLYVKAEKETTTDGGFNIESEQNEPTGRLTIKGSNGAFTAEFTLDKGSKMTSIIWYLDGEELEGVEKTCSFSAPQRRTYRVMCVVFNGSFVNSYDDVVIGGAD